MQIQLKMPHAQAAHDDEIELDDDALRVARWGVIVLLIGLGGFLLWAAVAPLGQGMMGSGTVSVAGERKIVQSLLGGSINRILVREGELVKQGQVLLQINTIQQMSERDVVLGQWLTARATEARLVAERLDHQEIQWPDDLMMLANDPRTQAAMQLQTNLFKTRQAELQNQLQILRHEQASLAEQLAGYEEIKRNQDSQLSFQKRELDGLRSLAQDGYVPRNRLFEAERSAAQLGSQRATAISDIGRTRQALNESKLKLLQHTQAFRSDVEAQLTRVAGEASSLADRYKALDFEVRNGAVAAPVAGQVMELAVHTEGGVVPAGQKLMEIVPIGSPWIVKARFPTKLIERLRPGMPVDMRFTSMDVTIQPVVEGKVATVSADQQMDEASKEPYIAVTVEVSPETAADLLKQGLNVRPGMQAEIIIKTGERTLLTYLMKPLTARLRASFKEE